MTVLPRSEGAFTLLTVMLDIKLFREDQGGDPEKVRYHRNRHHLCHLELLLTSGPCVQIRDSQRKRYAPVEWVDEVIAFDQQWRARTLKMAAWWCR